MCFSSQGSDKPELNFCNSVCMGTAHPAPSTPESPEKQVRAFCAPLFHGQAVNTASSSVPLHFLHTARRRPPGTTNSSSFFFFFVPPPFLLHVLRTSEQFPPHLMLLRPPRPWLGVPRPWPIFVALFLVTASCSCLMISTCFWLKSIF